MQTKILEVYDISIQFEGIVALDGVSFDMDPGTILGLIGPNGAGKTTLFNCLSRLCSFKVAMAADLVALWHNGRITVDRGQKEVSGAPHARSVAAS